MIWGKREKVNSCWKSKPGHLAWATGALVSYDNRTSTSPHSWDATTFGRFVQTTASPRLLASLSGTGLRGFGSLACTEALSPMQTPTPNHVLELAAPWNSVVLADHFVLCTHFLYCAVTWADQHSQVQACTDDSILLLYIADTHLHTYAQRKTLSLQCYLVAFIRMACPYTYNCIHTCTCSHHSMYPVRLFVPWLLCP